MKSVFAISWKRSKQPRKQRKYRYNSPLHVRRTFMKSLLAKELKTKYGKKNAIIRKGDTVKVMRGQFKGKTGKVSKVDYKKIKVMIEGIEIIKKDGNKVPYPIHPSNIMITTLKLEDKKRTAKLERK